MFYAAMIFWLLILIFAAYGTYQLWAGLIKPPVLNLMLLPGTLAAQSGRMVGMLISGGTIQNVSLLSEPRSSGSSSSSKSSKPKIPMVGALLIALLPLLACGFSLYVVVATIGQDVLVAPETTVSQDTLPMTFNSMWEVLRNSIDVAEQVTATILASDFRNWQTWLFLYLIVTLMIRLAPMPGMQRSTIGAVLLIGLVLCLIGQFAQAPEEMLQNFWNLLNFSVGSLLCLLLVSLMVRGGVGLFRILTNQTKLK